MNKIPIFYLFVFTSLLACSNNNGKIGFTYKFGMESINNFKVEFQLYPDSTYKISKVNYFFDRFEGKQSFSSTEGKLTSNEFDTFKELINKSNIEKMRDSYGFNDPQAERDIYFSIEVIRYNRSKFVSINSSTKEKFPKDFTELIKFTTNFISKNLETGN